MRAYLFILVICCLSCRENKSSSIPEAAGDAVAMSERAPFTGLTVTPVFEDSISVRAMATSSTKVYFAGDKGFYGHFDIAAPERQYIKQMFREQKDTISEYGETIKEAVPFRSIALSDTHYFLLSIGSPALLYKVDKEKGSYREVFKDEHSGAFYDSMEFWNPLEGIAMGDPQDGCLRIIITRDGGESWQAVPCEVLPTTTAGEAAFAASDTNIKIVGDTTWIVSGGMKSRVFYSPDKGKSWKVSHTPILQGGPTLGAYSMDFYDHKLGIIYGGDYTAPHINVNNIAMTKDGGVTWHTVADSTNQGYRSCVQFVPNSKGNEIVALGFEGISYSSDGGTTWSQLSEEPFLSFRFVSDSVAYAAGRKRIARLDFD